MALSWTLDKLGPFAHSAEDCGLVLHAIAGGDSKDPGSAGKSFYYTPQYSRPLKELRIGYAAADYSERADAAARPAFESALDVLRAAGAALVETKLPAFPYDQALRTILAAEQGAIFEPLIASGKVEELADKAQIAGLKASLEVAAKDYLKAMRIRRLIQTAFEGLFAGLDALIAPARTGPATAIGEPLIPLPGAAAAAVPTQATGFSGLISAGNLAGLPALALPCGFAGRLPVALQVVGAPLSENLLLAIGKEYQGHTDWHRRRPG